MIDPSVIEEIKNRIDIVDVVGDFVDLKKSGSSFKALSPFTTEKTPSFYVVPSKGIFKDFSSGKGGDAITFVMELDGLSYVEALKYLAKKYGIEIVEEVQSDEIQAAQNRRESLFIVLNFANELFKDLLKNHAEGKAVGYTYFRERGFSDETIQGFELGYSLDVWDHLFRTGKQKGYNEDLLEEAGLIVKKEGKTYDRFRGRVIFPIHNITGKVIAFGARILGKHSKQPKYLNSPETELYNKSKVLYGLFQAKQHIRKSDNCYLVEGYTDVISLHQAGIGNVVSSSGTSLTEDQVKLIRRYSQNVTVLFDGDAAGIRAALRGIDMLLEGDLNVRAVALPEGEDPDSYAKQLGTSAFQHYLETHAQDIILFKASLLLEDVKNDPIKKAEAIKEIVQTVSKISDTVKRSVYLKECSSLLEVHENVLIAEQNKLLIKRNRDSGQPVAEPQIPVEQILPVEEELDIESTSLYFQEKESIRVLINYGNEFILNQNEEDQYLVDYFLSEIEGIAFVNPVYNRILNALKDQAKSGKYSGLEHLLAVEDEEMKKAITTLSIPRYEISREGWQKKGIPVPEEKQQLKNVTFRNILSLKFRIIRHMRDQEHEKLKNASEEEEVKILEESASLKKIEQEIAAILGNVVTK